MLQGRKNLIEKIQMDFLKKNIACKHLENTDESFQTLMTDNSDICSYNEDDYASILGSFKINNKLSNDNLEQSCNKVKNDIQDDNILKQNRNNTLDTKLYQQTKKNTLEFEVYIEDYQYEDSEQETVEGEEDSEENYKEDPKLLKSTEKEIIEERLKRLNRKLGSQHIMSIIIEDRDESNEVSELSKDTLQKNISFKNKQSQQNKIRRSLSDTPFFAKKQQTLKEIIQKQKTLDPNKMLDTQQQISQKKKQGIISADLSPTNSKTFDQIDLSEQFFKQIRQQYIMQHNLNLMDKMNMVLQNQKYTDQNQTQQILDQILNQKVSSQFVDYLLKLKPSDKRNAIIKIQRFFKRRIFKKILNRIIEGKKQFRQAQKKTFFQLIFIQQQQKMILDFPFIIKDQKKITNIQYNELTKTLNFNLNNQNINLELNQNQSTRTFIQQNNIQKCLPVLDLKSIIKRVIGFRSKRIINNRLEINM